MREPRTTTAFFHACRAVAITGLILVGLIAPSVASARVLSAPSKQGANAPLLFNYKGDIWAWDGKALKARTQWGYNGRPILSPDGQNIAYLSVAKVAVDQIKQGKEMSGYLPQNVYILDIATNQALRIADQPAQATYGQPYYFVTRSQPTWAPDGTALAWTELVESSGTNEAAQVSLVKYDRASRRTQKLASIPLADVPMIPSALETAWGNGGIAVMSYIKGSEGDAIPQLIVYSTAGKLILQKRVAEAGALIWMDDNGTPVIGLQGATTKPDGSLQGFYWAVVNPATGTYGELSSGVPAVRSVGADPNHPVLFSPNSTDPTLTWQLVAIQGTKSFDFEPKNLNLASELAIAPDHETAAYIQDSGVMVLSGNKLVALKGADGAAIDASGLAWGPVEWFILHG